MLPSESEEAQNPKKVEMVYESFLYATKEEGVLKKLMIRSTFDPTLHPHCIRLFLLKKVKKQIEVVQVFPKGYKLKDRVLRPAMVTNVSQ